MSPSGVSFETPVYPAPPESDCWVFQHPASSIAARLLRNSTLRISESRASVLLGWILLIANPREYDPGKTYRVMFTAKIVE